jgi:hypothetical protein
MHQSTSESTQIKEGHLLGIIKLPTCPWSNQKSKGQKNVRVGAESGAVIRIYGSAEPDPEPKPTEHLRLPISRFANIQVNPVVSYKQISKVVSSEKVGGSGITSALGTWYGGVVMGVLLSFDEAAILYRDINSASS